MQWIVPVSIYQMLSWKPEQLSESPLEPKIQYFLEKSQVLSGTVPKYEHNILYFEIQYLSENTLS